MCASGPARPHLLLKRRVVNPDNLSTYLSNCGCAPSVVDAEAALLLALHGSQSCAPAGCQTAVRLTWVVLGLPITCSCTRSSHCHIVNAASDNLNGRVVQRACCCFVAGRPFQACDGTASSVCQH